MFPKCCTLLSEAVTWAEAIPALTWAVTDRTRFDFAGSEKGFKAGAGIVNVYEAPCPGLQDLSVALKVPTFAPSASRLNFTWLIEVGSEEELQTEATM